MVNVPVRAPPVFLATATVTVPLPTPVAPVVTIIHNALLVAVQAHPAVVVTLNVSTVASASTFRLPGDTEYEHDGGAAA